LFPLTILKMKIKTLIFSLLSCFTFAVNAQNTVLQRKIKWLDVDTWTINDYSKKVIAFENAQYSSEHDLPYFIETIPTEENTTYKAELQNLVLIPLTAEEEILVKDLSIQEDVAVQSFVTSDRGIKQVNFQFLPFVKKNGKVQKISTYELKISKEKSETETARKTVRTYEQNSVLASGKFVKVSVKESGIYKLTYEALNAMGINPANVRVFGYGGALLSQDFRKFKPDDLPEVAIYMNKGADGVFNAGDYILFYGHGIVDWEYNATERAFVHTQNHYSKEGYYFITSDAGVGKRIEDVQITVPLGIDTVTVNEFVDYQVIDEDKINLGNTGKVFYGDEFNVNPLSYNYNFSFPNITSADIKVKIDVAATAGATSSFTLKLNDSQDKTLSIPKKSSDSYELGKGYTGTQTFNSTNPSLTFTLTYNRPAAGARAYFNYLAVNARRSLTMTGNVMFFRNPDYLNSSVYSLYQLSGANENVQIWDITDQSNIKRIETKRIGDVIEFYDSNETLKQYVAIDPTAKNSFNLEPVSIGVVPNQNLHGMKPAEFVIVTHPNFLSQAEKLAKAHREMEQMSVNVITTEQVYNEFASGVADATAIRWAMKKWYDESNKQYPKYLLLFGRGSYDNRSLIFNSGDNLIPTYQADNSLDAVKSYVTDDYYGVLDDDEGVNIHVDKIDLGIGRFPVSNTQQADDVVNKNIAYMQNEVKGNWKNQFAFVADDGDATLHMRDMDKMVEEAKAAYPAYQYNKIYLDAYKQEVTASGESYPLARTRLHSLINSGLFMLNYMGHAGPHGWSNEGVLTTTDVKEMYNTKLPIWVAATCDFVLFDVKNISAGEFVLLNPTGGGIGLYSAARVVFASENAKLNRLFVLSLFSKDTNGEYPRLGDAVRMSKKDAGIGINKLSYVLLGNPALKLNYPTPYKVITEKLNDQFLTGSDTLKALSVDKFSGFIADSNNQKVSDFDGVVEITMYDKIQRVTTLDNHNDGRIVYNDRSNVIYSGKANVTNGEFSFTTMIPRDIRYNYGSGRISYYASEPDSHREAQGFTENFIVGGSSTDFVEETDGPTVEMYLNTPNFVPGGKVNETPLFVAKISDISGINTVGSGIGHDLRLVIDNNPFSSYILNDYFEADTDSYQSGRVRMKLPQLEAGKHTLTLYAWDLMNNSTTQNLDFEVVPGLKPEIFSVSNYPNPAKTSTTFVVEHDRPEVILTTTLDVFDISGRKIYTMQQNSAEKIYWDLIDASGRRIQPGIYLYNISIQTANSKLSSKANKLIVLGQ